MTDAVLLSCHGTIADLGDVPAFIANIRRGRPAPPELIEEVVRRYRTIGGSPLMEITCAQAKALEARLGVPVHVAGRLWHPYPKDVLAALDPGVTRVVSLPLAPQSVHVYHAAVREVARVEILEVPAWGNESALIDAYIETIDEGLKESAAAERAPIVLTAHSLPMRALALGDPYETDFRAMAELVARRLRERGHPVHIAFQSQGASAEPWLGPTLPETFAALAGQGHSEAFIAPIGFVAEHIETLYDLDVEAPELAHEAGLSRIGRARTVGARPRFIDALEAVARRALAPTAATSSG